MVQLLEIQGEEVRVVETQVVRKVALKDLMPHLVQRPPITISNLPRTAVFVHWDETNPARKMLYVLCEMAPGVRTITKGYGTQKRKYRLAFPWTYFWFVCTQEGTRWIITNYKAFHAPKQYSGPPGELYTAFCPNITHATANICFGTTGAPPGPIDQQIDWIVNNWYVTEFNDHLDNEMPHYPFGGRNFKNWVDQTAINPACWQDFPEWTNGNRKKFTLEDIIKESANVRPEILMAEYAIPEIKTPVTFGAADEWLREKVPNATDRWRLLKSLEASVKENPGFIEEPVIDTTGALDDGGIPA